MNWEKLLSAQQQFKTVKSIYENEIEQVENIGAKVITYWDDQYPQQLKNIYYPPLILYVLGDLTENDSQSISIVGTRTATDYGKTIVTKFGFFESLLKDEETVAKVLRYLPEGFNPSVGIECINSEYKDILTEIVQKAKDSGKIDITMI